MDSPTTLPYIDLPNSRSLDKLVVRKDYEAAYEFLESLFRKDLEENSDLSGGVDMWSSRDWCAFLNSPTCIHEF